MKRKIYIFAGHEEDTRVSVHSDVGSAAGCSPVAYYKTYASRMSRCNVMQYRWFSELEEKKFLIMFKMINNHTTVAAGTHETYLQDYTHMHIIYKYIICI